VLDGLANKIVIVTGASGGIGSACAQAFAAAKCRVALVARDETKLNASAEKIASKGGQALAVVCDVTHRDEVQTLGARVRDLWGETQILVNCAGIAQAMRFIDMTDELWDRAVETNLTGAYNCCKVFLPGMARSRWGRIINIASTAAKVGYPHVAAYTSSKHGLLGLTRSLALETARQGITVNAICPGYVDDERTHENARLMAEKTGKTVEEILNLFAASAPQNRLIAPGEVAALAVFLASAKLAGMTGQAINVDGGAVMV
jgi:NAD(P)-dependent dehydrogenase (short-subunit alcohol dehydrogenase family)